MSKQTQKITSWFQYFYIYIILQQIIVASSSIWLTKLILSISSNQPLLIWLWLYLISLTLPYIPGALALIEVSKSQIKSCVNYVQKFSEIYPGKILKWTDHEQHSLVSSILAGEACPTIREYIEYLYHLASSGFNVILNLAVLALLIDSSLILTYITGVILSFFILCIQKNLKSKLALNAQESRIHWTSLLIKAWDNVLLNNSYNSNIWNKKKILQGKVLAKDTITLEKFNQFIGITMAFALILPSIFLIAYLAIKNLENLSFLATLTVLFPRLFLILTYSYELLFLISDLPLQKAKLNTVLSVIQPSSIEQKNDTLLNRIHWDMVHINNSTTRINAKDLIEKIPNKGRITVSGENGSGKSSLLLWIKKQYKDKAFYLPSKHDLLFTHEKNQLSSGQLAYTILKEIKEKVTSPIILLDEWDTNLDMKNRHELSLLIDELSSNHCIIEVLHTRH